MEQSERLDAAIALAQHRGFVFPSGDIYGGTRSAWDYGPYGVALKENIKRQWWKTFVQRRGDMVGLDSAIILPTAVWESSGHLKTFSDPLTESLVTHKRYRADHLFEAYEEKHGHPPENGLADIPDPEHPDKIGQWTEIGEKNEIYPGAVIGVAPQDLRYSGERAYTRVGHRNVIREYVTVHRASDAEGMTSISNPSSLSARIQASTSSIMSTGGGTLPGTTILRSATLKIVTSSGR